MQNVVSPLITLPDLLKTAADIPWLNGHIKSKKQTIWCPFNYQLDHQQNISVNRRYIFHFKRKTFKGYITKAFETHTRKECSN